MDLTSRLRSIVRGGGTGDRSAGSSAAAKASADRRSLGEGWSDPAKPIRELTYEPDNGGYRATIDLERVGEMLGGRPLSTPFGQCLVVDRRYEADRFHGDIRIEDCEIHDTDGLRLLDPLLEFPGTDVS